MAGSLKKEQRILPKVPRKKGHQTNDDAINFVKQFYEGDEDTKDIAFGKYPITLLRISKKVHKQHSGKFKAQWAFIFFYLRPEQVVTAIDSCMNNVCVCVIYQNAKLGDS